MHQFTSLLNKMRFMTLQIKEENENGNYHSDRVLIFRSEFNAMCWQFLQLVLGKTEGRPNDRAFSQMQKDFLEMHQGVIRHQQEWLHTRATADPAGYLASARLITIRVLRFIDNALQKIGTTAQPQLPTDSSGI